MDLRLWDLFGKWDVEGYMNRWKLDNFEACMSWMGMIDRVILELP